MAKAVVTLDTETGKLEVKVGGKVVENASYVNIGSYKAFDHEQNMMVDKVTFSVETHEMDEDGVMTHTRLMAKETIDGQQALSKGQVIDPKNNDFVIVSHSSAVEEEAVKLLLRQ